MDLIKSSMDMTPSILDKSLEFQQKQLEQMERSHQLDRESFHKHELDQLGRQHTDEIRSIHQNYSNKIFRYATP